MDFLGRPVDIESARENFYTELIQYISLPWNYSFIPIIRKINQEIKRYTQQQFPITYADKSKKKLQTPAVTPREIQLPMWKKQKIKFPLYPLYYHTPSSIINITSTDMSTSNTTSIFGQLPFQNKQKKQPFQQSIQQPLQSPLQPQQPLQQPLQQPQQQLQPIYQQLIRPMAYAPIAKLKKFTGKENNAQVWLNNITQLEKPKKL
ncbi:hypothetical protein G9A89_021881 [Geosiphon pyriformis]|nr:hypothetical protein G9A89_021881 [Geosiphon pyriformis]